MFIFQPHDTYRLGDFLRENLSDHSWTSFRAAVAYAKHSGTSYLHDPLQRFAQRASVRMTIGINSAVTTVEALRDLLDALAGRGELWIYKNAAGPTFHPKVYLFRNETRAVAAIGSGNLTQGGLYTNYEAGVVVEFDLTSEEHRAELKRLEDELDRWSTHAEGLCLQLEEPLLNRLVEVGLVPTETAARSTAEGEARTAGAGGGEHIFIPVPVPKAPLINNRYRPNTGPATPSGASTTVPLIRVEEPIIEDEEEPIRVPVPLPAVAPRPGRHSVFLMTLQTTDVGHGQVTEGAQRRSPEIFIPLAARDEDPEFWGWPDEFIADPNWTGSIDDAGRGKMDRHEVPMLLGERVISATIWYNPQKRDIRIRSENLRRAGRVGDLLYVERTDGTSGYTYLVQIIPQGTAQHSVYLARCVRKVRPPSRKLFGYV